MDRFIHTNGIELHCLDHPGKRIPIVLLPGLTANAHSFDGLVAAGLSPHHRVLALDLRGRGLSAKPATGYSMADHAKDVIGLLDTLNIDQVILGGHSFGGLLCFYMAARHPDRVHKMIVIDAAGEMHPNVRKLIQPSIDRLGKRVASWDAYLATMKKMPFLQNWWDPTIESYLKADIEVCDDGTVIPRSRPEAIIEAVDQALMEDWELHLAAIKTPMLLLNALGSFGLPGSPPLLPRDNALSTVQAVPHGHYAEVPGNHMTMLYGAGANKMVASIIDFVDSE